MYLSRVQIDTNNRRKIRDLTHLGAYHYWVEQSFPEEVSQGVRTRKLWRKDQLYGNQYLLLVSEEKPDHELLERYGVPGSAQSLEYSSFINQLEVGMCLAFRITVNPVISKSGAGYERRGRLLPHVTEEHQRRYLLERAERNGFSLHSDRFMLVESGRELFKKVGQKDIYLVKATFEGKLQVTDSELFKKTLTEGIGKKRAYGFGMMTVILVGD